MSVMGALITEESFLSVFPETRDPTIQGIVIAAFELGAIVGSLACLEIGDRLGRRATVWLGMIFMIVGGVTADSRLVHRPTYHRSCPLRHRCRFPGGNYPSMAKRVLQA